MEKKLSEVVGQVTSKAQQQQQSTQIKQTPQKARFKLVFIYKNGSYSPPYFSYDRHGKATQEDVGLAKLVNLIHKRRGEFVVASIFASVEAEPYTHTKEGQLNRIYNLLIYKEILNHQGEWMHAFKFTEGRAQL